MVMINSTKIYYFRADVACVRISSTNNVEYGNIVVEFSAKTVMLGKRIKYLQNGSAVPKRSISEYYFDYNVEHVRP